ncbi:Rrf2 family transcriptional regulator [Hydrotalea sp.]|uniref:RrF2 family transcriptional regulator n=1 Tax=Hydrotalea sp. TaxID=2881279 RepID=UPI00260548F0|nr:Rrf2 family transcriptional regulator [Hydrotalea sp.]
MFSKTCEYAIRAILYIAQKSKHGIKVSIKDIAKGIDSPEYFLGKILQDVSRKGLIQSLKGPTGGFYLDETNLQYTLADVVKVVDGDKIFSGCGLGLRQCSEKMPCPIHNDFKKIRTEIFELLQKAKLGEFNELLEQQLAVLKR